jgi:hypothetical protein
MLVLVPGSGGAHPDAGPCGVCAAWRRASSTSPWRAARGSLALVARGTGSEGASTRLTRSPTARPRSRNGEAIRNASSIRRRNIGFGTEDDTATKSRPHHPLWPTGESPGRTHAWSARSAEYDWGMEGSGFGGLFGDPDELQRRLGEFAEQMQGAQRLAWADNAIKLAVDLTVASLQRINVQGTTEQQAEQLRRTMAVVFPEAVTLVREAREGLS